MAAAKCVLIVGRRVGAAKMTYDYFIAGRYRNADVLLDLARRLRALGASVYCFADAETTMRHLAPQEANPEDVMQRFEALSDWRVHPDVRSIFEADMAAQRASAKFILVLPAGKSGHIEAGVAYGMGKKCIVIGEQKESESLYLIFDEHYETPEEFLKTLL